MLPPQAAAAAAATPRRPANAASAAAASSPFEVPAAAAPVDEVAAAFARYNSNGDGMLDLPEIQVLLEDANFTVDAAYVNGVADMFGTYDTDGSGGVELPEVRFTGGSQAIHQLLVLSRSFPDRLLVVSVP